MIASAYRVMRDWRTLDGGRKISSGSEEFCLVQKLKCLAAVWLMMGWTTSAAGDDSVTVTFYHYPPEIRVTDGEPRGKYIDAWEAIAKEAGLTVDWIPSTIDEEARMLDDGRRPICTTGRMPTAERARRWDFLPYLFDFVPGDVLLTLKEHRAKIEAHGHVSSLIRDKKLTGALLESGIYGSEVDVFLLSGPDWIIRTGKTDLQLMNMVLQGRAHYTIVPEMQWQEARHALPMAQSLVEMADFGAHPSYPIYIACSRSLPRPMFEALGQAMKALNYKPGLIPR